VELERDIQQAPDRPVTGKVFLIGAGPGDPGLLTLKAARTLADCDVVVYDHLVNPEVLSHCRRGAELIYAGKRAGERSIAQSEISLLLIERARAGQIVGRLKGGDPFIFGRGAEEALALVAAGVDWEVIPGISSGIAAAAYAGIPLTHRHCSSSVAFITGHEGKDKAGTQVDWRTAALAADTLVIFMCGTTISNIANELIAGGRSGSTPIALVRWGTYEFQEVFTATLADLVPARLRHPHAGAPTVPLSEPGGDLRFDAPVIAIVGESVKLAETLQWFRYGTRLSLANKHAGDLELQPATL